MIEILLSGQSDTEAIARRLAAAAQPGDVLALSGPLGIGKSVFARAFIRTLAGIAEEVPSPTFTLVQSYDTRAGAIWHFDLYRVTVPEEALELGFEDSLADIVLIEWPERLATSLPARRLDVSLDEGDTLEARTLRVMPQGGSTLAARAGM